MNLNLKAFLFILLILSSNKCIGGVDEENLTALLKNNCTKKAKRYISNITRAKDNSTFNSIKIKVLINEGDYDKALQELKKEIESNNNKDLLPLGISTALKYNDINTAKKWLEQYISQNPKKHWARLLMLQLSMEKLEKVYQYCIETKTNASFYLECSKLFQAESKESQTLAKKAIEVSQFEKEDPYSYIITAKSYFRISKIKESIQTLNKINKESPAYESSLREKIYIQSETGDYSNAKSNLALLLKDYSQNSINHIIAYDFYKRFKQPQNALEHLSSTSECNEPNWPEISLRSGYISEAIGIPIADKQTIQFALMSFISHHRPQESIQNFSQGFGENLYYFRNTLARIKWTYSYKKNRSFYAQYTFIDKKDPINEQDYIYTLGISNVYKWLNSFVTHNSSISLIPVYSKITNQQLRTSYLFNNNLSIYPNNNEYSHHFSYNYGIERLLRNNQISSYNEFSYLIQRKFSSLKLDLTSGFSVKEYYDEYGIIQKKFFLGASYEVSPRLILKNFNEFFYVSSAAKAITINLEAITPITKTLNLKLGYTMEKDIVIDKFSQERISLQASKIHNFFNYNIKSIVEFNHINNFESTTHYNYLNIKVGVPL